MLQMHQQPNSFNNFRNQQMGFRFRPPGQFHQASEDIYTGGGSHPWRRRGRFFGRRGTRGFGVNLNQRPGHQRGQDGVLVFPDSKGRYNKRAVQNTNDMMKAARGNYDFNGDGRVDRLEGARGRGLRHKYRSIDRNRDGRLDAGEMSRAGGKVWVDKSRGGGVGRKELHSVYRVPTKDAWGRRGTSRLDFVDPFSRTAHTSPNRPWNFGGYPRGCGCGHGGFHYGNQFPSSFGHSGRYF